MREWYVNASRQAVNWGTAMPSLTSSVDIYRLVEDDHGGERTYLWINAGRPTTAARKAAAIAAASSDAVPAAPTHSRTQPTRTGTVTGDQIADGTIGVADLALAVKATIPLLTPATSAATTGALTAGATHRLDATAAPLTRTLPTAAAAGAGGIVVVKKLDTTSNAVTISPAGSDTINTVVGTRTLTFPREAVHLRSDGVSDWTVVASDTPKSGLDATYAPITGSATYAGLANARPAAGLLWYFGGDSITNGSAASNFVYSFAPEACSIVGGMVARPDSIEGGTAGDTSAQLLARLPAGLAQYQPQATVIAIGTNDAGQAIPLATTTANLIACIQAAKRYGPVVLCTIPPRGTGATTAIKQATAAINYWIRTFGPMYGCEIADNYAVLADTTTGDYATGYDSGDAVHPTALAHARMAAETARAMKRASTRTAPYGLVTGVGAANLIADPLNARASVTSGWFEWAGGTGTAPTYSFVTDTTGVLPAGRWAQMDFDATSSGGTRRLTTPGMTTGYAVGDTLVLAAHLQIEDTSGTWQADVAAGTGSVSLSLINQSAALIAGSQPFQRTAGIQDPVTGFWNLGPVCFPVVVPSGTTTINGWFSLTCATGKHYKMRIGCVGVINATTLGMASQFAWGSGMVNT